MNDRYIILCAILNKMKLNIKYDFERTDSGLYVPKGINKLKEKKSPWRIITMIITAIPLLGAFGYIIALLHEIGYIAYFKLPLSIIRLDATSILEYVSIALLLTALFTTTFIIWVLIHYSNVHRVWDIIALLNAIIITGFLYAATRNFLGQYSNYIAIVLLLFQMYLVTVVRKSKIDPLIGIKNRLKNNYIAYVIWIAFALCFLAYISGSTDVLNQNTYSVPSTNPDSVVIRIYGDNVICVPLNSDNTSVKPSFFVLKLNENDLTFNIRKFSGRLGVSR